MITMNNIRQLGLTKGAGYNWRSLVTHCVKGHEYTPENTLPRDGGGRVCRKCKNAHRLRRWHEKRRQSA